MTAASSGRVAVTRRELRDAALLARTELRCRARGIRSNRRQLLGMATATLLFGVGFPLLVAEPVTAYGAALAGGAPPVGPTGVAVSIAAGLGLYAGGAGGFTQEVAGATGPLVRTSIPPRAVSLGRLGSEVTEATTFGVVPAVALLLEVAVGGGPVPALLLGLGLIPVFLAAVGVGRLLGSGLRLVNRWLQVSLWTKALLYVGATVAVYAVTFQFFGGEPDPGAGLGGVALGPLLPGEPLQAYASVTLGPLGAGVRPLGVIVAVGTLAAIPVALVAAVRLETYLLCSDDAEQQAAVGSRGVPRPLAWTPAGRVAWRYLLRTRRDPRTLAHLGPLLFGALPMAATFVQNPETVWLLGPAAAIVGGAVVAGAAYCLNPLGDDRDQLALLLTSTRSSGVLLRGRALAGVCLGLPPALAVAAAILLVRGQPVALLTTAGFAVVLTVSGTGTALGIGAIVPRFERREYMSVERAHPSMVALLGFMFGGMFVGAVGLVLLWGLFDTAGTSHAVLVLGYLAVVAAIGAGGYRYATRRFDGLTLDDV